MKKLILAVAATVALATATTASASSSNGGGRHSRRHDLVFRTATYWHHAGGAGVFEKLDGTGSSLDAGTSSASGAIHGRPLQDGTFAASLSADWSKATANRHGGSCAPATGTLTLSDSSGDTLDTSLTGVSCTVGSNPWNVAGVFFGKAQVTSATGTLSSVTGYGRVLLVEKTDGTVEGFAFAGFRRWHERRLAGIAKGDAHRCGWH